MPLSAGTRLGPYEILAPLGAGGMGEVYKARDTRLDRTVAIKVMPQHIAQREDLRQRFEREARVVSSLNHPYICVLHDIGKQDGVDFMVLEHLEGETLEARLTKGPLPLDQVFKYAAQIADALDRAHRSGVSHRDVKPSNIMLTRDGVKVLDFGLAKSMPRAGPSDQTLTLAMTGEGTVLGTPQYMAPELFEGKEADARSDIFGFGCVLYQMVTGKRAFDGKTRVSVVASIIGAEPAPMSSLQPVTPPALERLVQGCLKKDPEERYQSMWDVLIDVRGISEGRADAQADTPAKTGKLAWLPWAIAGLFLIAAAAATSLWLRQPAPETRSAQFTLDSPPDNQFTNPFGATAVSPDGRYVVFGTRPASGGTSSLWLRPIDSLSARPLPGTETGNFPFWSPDSKSIAFFAGGKLKRVDIDGGAPLVLCDASSAGGSAVAAVGGAWNRDGVILFESAGGLLRVAASGGVPALVTKTDASRHETDHGFPQFLPDGKRFLYLIQSSDSNVTGLYAGSLDRPQERVQILRTGTKVVYAAPVSGRSGQLLYLRDQTLMAQRFDPGNLRLEGEPAPLAEDVATLNARAAFWVSDAGLLVYRTGTAAPMTKMVWMGRDGKRLEEVGPEDTYGHVRLSPDGKKAAVTRRDATNNRNVDVWLFDFGRAVMTRLTFDPKLDRDPVWSPDGRQIAFSSDRSGVFQIYRKDAGGGGQEEQLTEGLNPKFVTDWSRDGRYLLYNEAAPQTGEDVWALPLEATGGPSGRGVRKPILVLQTPFSERHAVFSPDGKWIAYESNESGQDEIYVMAFPGSFSAGAPTSAGGAGTKVPAGKWQVSNQGGTRPRWRGDGKELFYVSLVGTNIMAAGIRLSPAGVESDTPRVLFTTPALAPADPVPSPYDVTADGQRFLMLLPPGSRRGVPSLTVVVNWQAGLKQ